MYLISIQVCTTLVPKKCNHVWMIHRSFFDVIFVGKKMGRIRRQRKKDQKCMYLSYCFQNSSFILLLFETVIEFCLYLSDEHLTVEFNRHLLILKHKQETFGFGTMHAACHRHSNLGQTLAHYTYHSSKPYSCHVHYYQHSTLVRQQTLNQVLQQIMISIKKKK